MPAATKAVSLARKQLSGYPSQSGSKSSPRPSSHRATKPAARSTGHRAPARSRAADRQQIGTGFSMARHGASRGLNEAHRVTSRAHRGYSGVLFAEYLLAAVLICLGVFVGDEAYAAKMGRALLRLSAVTIVFFVLALVASGENSGKFAAAFGGLIDVAILFDSAKSGTIKNIGSVFSGNSTTAGGGGGDNPPRAEATAYELPTDEQNQHTILAG